MKVMVLAPHGDDEVLGCGGTIAKHIKQKHQVEVCFLKKHYDKRSLKQYKQTYKAQEVLGYQSINFLDIQPKKLASFDLSSVKLLEKYISRNLPDILYIPCIKDAHQDHQNTVNITSIACRIWGPARVNKILSCETISSTYNGFNVRGQFTPTYYNVLDEECINIKQQALRCYEGELMLFPHPRSIESLLIHAQKRGMECGAEYAEAFEIIRNIQI